MAAVLTVRTAPKRRSNFPQRRRYFYNAWQDHGQGSDLGTLTFAHETLRRWHIKISRQIKLVMNDTRKPNLVLRAAAVRTCSRVMPSRYPCEMLLKAMSKSDGTYRTYDEMVAENIPLRYDGKWVAAARTACSETTGQGNPFPIYMYGIFMRGNGSGREDRQAKCVETYIGSLDVGTIINKATVDGQIYGGLTQGIGLG